MFYFLCIKSQAHLPIIHSKKENGAPENVRTASNLVVNAEGVIHLCIYASYFVYTQKAQHVLVTG